MGVWEHGWRQGWIEGFSIFMACVIIVVVTSGNNYVKEKQFQQLVAKASEDYVAVYRGNEGETQTIRVEKLVVGDIIKLETGQKIPADCIVIKASDLETDEASLTGEPESMHKSALTEDNLNHGADPFIFSQTLITQGQGLAVVCAVGTKTRSGRAEEKLSIEG